MRPSQRPRSPAPHLLGLLLLLLAGRIAAEDLGLTAEQRAWIAAHPVVRIQMSDSSPPFEFRERGTWQGLAYDMLVAACGRLGIRVEVSGMRWDEALAAVGEGKGVDLLLAVTSSPERARQMLLSRPYLSFPQVIITDPRRRFISGLADLHEAVIAVESNYVMEEWLRRDLPRARFVTATDTIDVLRAVAQGQADAYVGNLALATWLIDHDGLVNLGVAAPSGYGDEQFSLGIRRDWPELVALLDRAFAAMPDGERHAIHQRWLAVRYDYGIRPRDIILWVVGVAAVALLFIVQLRRMVTARTRDLARAVELRTEGEARFRLLIERAPEGVVLLDPASHRFIAANPAAERIYGVPRARIVGAAPAEFGPAIQPDGEAADAKARRLVAAAVAGGEPVTPWLHVHPDGTPVPCEVRLIALPWDGGTIIRCSVLDMRERQRHEEILRRTETLAGLGQLAGGMAHDFNNALTGMLGYAELIAAASQEPRIQQYANGIRKAVENAHGMTSRLLAYARRGTQAPAPYDGHAAIEDALSLFAAVRTARVRVVRTLAAPRSRLVGQPGTLQNAVLNLCLNARDAMPGGGTVEVGTSEEDIAAAGLAATSPYTPIPGPHLHIAVRDAGSGMAPEVLAHCGEPLFSTKGEKGTGLGLAGVHACVVAHGGAMRIDSEPGRGTTVHLWLPLAA